MRFAKSSAPEVFHGTSGAKASELWKNFDFHGTLGVALAGIHGALGADARDFRCGFFIYL